MDPLKRNFSRNTIPAIVNGIKVNNREITEFESMPAVGNTVSLYFLNNFSSKKSLGNASS